MSDGTTLKARPTTYKGIQMRSRLEARYAQWLDRQQIEWQYEPRCFASEEGQYLPDFLLFGVNVMGSQRPVYVEVKPTTAFAAETVYRWSGIITATEPGAYLLLEVDSLPSPILVPPAINGCMIIPASWTRQIGGSIALAPHVTTDWRKAS